MESDFKEQQERVLRVEVELRNIREDKEQRSSDNAAHLQTRRTAAKELRRKLGSLQGEWDHASRDIQDYLHALPNLTSSLTPRGDEAHLKEYINYDPELASERRSEQVSHVDIGKTLDLLDFTSSSTSTGWGWYYLKNEAALLEQALVQYALTVAMRRGWKPVSPPSIVYSHIANACGFQPRDQNEEQQIWSIEQNQREQGKPKRSLSATAEIPFAAMYAGTTIDHARLPLKVVGPSRCYRAEAGARGVDTKGLYRVHEFTKVEMFAWTDAGAVDLESEDWTAHATNAFNEMVEIQKEILSSLGLRCRVLEMPSTDLGASAYRKIDIEAFFPSRSGKDGGWGEVTSASICTDYQSKRLGTKMKRRGPGAKSTDENVSHPHTVNGTAMAVPRVLAAILENGWSRDKETVTIPEVLRPYMGGITEICRKT